MLEHHPEFQPKTPPLSFVQRRNISPFDANTSGIRECQTQDMLEKHALTNSTLSKDNRDFLVGNAEIQSLKKDSAPKRFVKSCNLNHTRCRDVTLFHSLDFSFERPDILKVSVY